MHSHCTAKVALVFGGLLGQDVTFEGLAAFNGSTGTNTEALFGAAFGLHLGHVNAPLIVLVRRMQKICSLVGPEPLLTKAAQRQLLTQPARKPVEFFIKPIRPVQTRLQPCHPQQAFYGLVRSS
jgi:hypothetical protein